MSRAFVKETDGDLPGDLPELPVSPHPNYVTARGLELLRTRLADAARRRGERDLPAIERAHIEREMRWLRARIESAMVVTPGGGALEQVGFGMRVEIADADDRRFRYRIVGEDEADPERGLISHVSPLARALLGARIGETRVWPRPAGDLEVEVVALDAGP
ncbi:GreA/GreB family elongation factor [Coralloluteibacterium stylophorae]|uniref:GreA/GreB family elongation factor n=1 Tax=Coralloluteibacterium stylophorae TaxID=1776034 RepID=A0A8J7VVA8_9GAMM|nr:GreA/GreB family elongation factor [Coralloluteibacterium stylophorae]MBS7455648.1 GreA/GreB family elongation factor [Coralloluteibacterium stylophorae]